MADASYPSGAHILSLIAGIFIILSGLVYIAVGALVGSVFAGLGVAGAAVAALGAVALIFGVIIIYGAVQLRTHPSSSKTWGAIILILSLLSFVGGSGFFIGLILGLIGGILALVWKAPPAPMTGGQWGQPGTGAAWGQPTAAAAPPPAGGAPLAPGQGQKFCSSCGSPNAPNATFCAKCGAPLTA
ncbi:MAG TPA: zinc ribbon domain-containing protein [Thermoplasmata archaeon]|nr:zinc ribbon domain-containing protein [Thermoplasmata archaeon]